MITQHPTRGCRDGRDRNRHRPDFDPRRRGDECSGDGRSPDEVDQPADGKRRRDALQPEHRDRAQEKFDQQPVPGRRVRGSPPQPVGERPHGEDIRGRHHEQPQQLVVPCPESQWHHDRDERPRGVHPREVHDRPIAVTRPDSPLPIQRHITLCVTPEDGGREEQHVRDVEHNEPGHQPSGRTPELHGRIDPAAGACRTRGSHNIRHSGDASDAVCAQDERMLCI